MADRKKRCSFPRLRLVKKQRAGDFVSEKPTVFLRSCGENQHPGDDSPRRKTGNALKLEIVVKDVLNEKMEQASESLLHSLGAVRLNKTPGSTRGK